MSLESLSNYSIARHGRVSYIGMSIYITTHFYLRGRIVDNVLLTLVC